jgi:hypothetical protein
MAQLVNSDVQVLRVPIAGRTPVPSPIGTTSPNTGAAANTQSSYSPGAFTSGVNVQGTATAYTLQLTDYQGLILFNTASAVTVTLNYACGGNFTATILNIGAGAITLTPIAPPPESVSPLYLVNGASSLTLASKAGCIVAFAQRQWYAYVGTTFIPTLPMTFTPIAGEFLTGYNATTGLFSAATGSGGGGGVFADDETPSGLVNSSNTVFTLANTPSPGASLQLFENGLLQNPSGNDYSLSGNTITFTIAPSTGSALLAWYRFGSAPENFSDAETPFGTINGVNQVFDLASSPTPAGSLELYENGLLQAAGVDYVLAGNVVTFTAPPPMGTTLLAWYRY